MHRYYIYVGYIADLRNEQLNRFFEIITLRTMDRYYIML